MEGAYGRDYRQPLETPPGDDKATQLEYKVTKAAAQLEDRITRRGLVARVSQGGHQGCASPHHHSTHSLTSVRAGAQETTYPHKET